MNGSESGALTYEAGPHRVVNCRVLVLLGFAHWFISVTVVAHPDYQVRNA